MRIGHGFDAHKFVENRKLILGGETIPYHLGLEDIRTRTSSPMRL